MLNRKNRKNRKRHDNQASTTYAIAIVIAIVILFPEEIL
jgi:hypothetical protein